MIAYESELFARDAGAMLSPRLAWRKKHGAQTLHDDCIDDEGFSSWIAWRDSDCVADTGFPRMRREEFGEGPTEDEALGDLAVKRGIPLWNEEPLP